MFPQVVVVEHPCAVVREVTRGYTDAVYSLRVTELASSRQSEVRARITARDPGLLAVESALLRRLSAMKAVPAPTFLGAVISPTPCVVTQHPFGSVSLSSVWGELAPEARCAYLTQLTQIAIHTQKVRVCCVCVALRV